MKSGTIEAFLIYTINGFSLRASNPNLATFVGEIPKHLVPELLELPRPELPELPPLTEVELPPFPEFSSILRPELPELPNPTLPTFPTIPEDIPKPKQNPSHSTSSP
ncbi:hypothetical protein SLEP1_g29963 [Rubroshorea leprosula]|uniref:Uncharacterized protein n=1 Tax=Rubroshorea leprosula TaxID=152421 RepID=A0AAV5K7A1_9ROSI|nr:hypothetical protein SLEP1_g29963 [Rubroshorea leprosula]